jgi:hypothetical protein
MEKKFKVRDLIFLFIIFDLFFVVVFVVTLYLKKYVVDYSLIMDQISLASSLISIILAIVAIIYAFLQSIDSGKQSRTIEILLSKMGQKVDEIGPLKQEVLDSKREITQVLGQLNESLESSYQQFDNQVKKSGKDLGSNAGELYKSFFENYLKTAINDISKRDQSVVSKLIQEFHVTLVTDSYKGNKDLHDNIPIEYVKYFREITNNSSAIGSNMIVFSDYTGLSFTLSFKDEKKWDANEIKQILEKYHSHGLSIFTVAKLFY